MAGQLINTTSNINAHKSGFTIVELLIVIVVIGILAAITIISFNGVSNRAKVALISSDLTNVSQKLKTDQAINGLFPATLAATDGGKGVPASPGTTYQYTVDNSVNPATFCVTAVNGSNAYFMTDTGVPTVGACPGHSLTGGAPVVAGYYDFSGSLTMANLPFPTIPDGSWMVMVMAYNVATPIDAVPPSGWTTLYARNSAGTLTTMVFGKIKTSSEPSTFSVTGSINPTSANGVMFWGSGASSDLNTWIKGAIANRNGTTGQQYITTTPTIATTVAQSLVLSISTERTAITETDISSLSGATRWFYVPQIDNATPKIQTITLSYATLATATTSTPVVVTYPNLQTVNGTAFQIGLPPS
ncbi:MAG TPA: type II secretion system protein [Candidatus Microsaccharimonas sp.]